MADRKIKTEVLVIGGGPAGITFCRTLKKLKPKTTITMLRPEKHSMVYCAIPYALEGLFDPSKVFKRNELVTDVGVDLIQRAASKVDLKAKSVVDDAGDVYTADILFLATGANNIVPPIPGSDAMNVYTVKTQRDMEALREKIDNGAKRAIVVGAGAIGIEQAQAYRSRGMDVCLIDMASRVLPAMADEDMTTPLHETIRQQGIKLILSSKVERIKKTDKQAEQVVLSNGETINLNPTRDFICFAVGMEPEVRLFQGQGLEMDQEGIVVDSRMRTNIPDVYAAGDCCGYISGIDKKPIGGKLATNAVPMAKTAAYVVAGENMEYAGFFNGAATCVCNLRVASTGFTDETAQQRGIKTVLGRGETTTVFPMMPDPGSLQVKIVADADDSRIIGGQVINVLSAADKIDIITLAIQQRLTLQDLSKLSYSAQPWQSYMPARSAIVQACENALNSLES